MQPKSNLVFRLINWIARIFKIAKGGSKQEFEVVHSYWPAFIYTPKVVVDVATKPHLSVAAGPARLESSKAYKDPFTELSTTLFQDYEPFHTWKDVKDAPYRDASKYQLLFSVDSLVAKKIDDPTVSRQERRKAFPLIEILSISSLASM